MRKYLGSDEIIRIGLQPGNLFWETGEHVYLYAHDSFSYYKRCAKFYFMEQISFNEVGLLELISEAPYSKFFQRLIRDLQQKGIHINCLDDETWAVWCDNKGVYRSGFLGREEDSKDSKWWDTESSLRVLLETFHSLDLINKYFKG